jgi:hypothetical protein
MLSHFSQFWQGVVSSVLATIIIAIAVKLWGLFSTQAQQSQQRRQDQFKDLRAKMASPDSVVRVEGYFVTLFTILRFLFIGSILWVLAWSINLFAPRAALLVALASLVIYYLGLRWLYNTLKPAGPTSIGAGGTPLTIHSAKYGAMGQYIDVAPQLNERLSNGRLEVYAGNQIAGDPCANMPKELLAGC